MAKQSCSPFLSYHKTFYPVSIYRFKKSQEPLSTKLQLYSLPKKGGTGGKGGTQIFIRETSSLKIQLIFKHTKLEDGTPLL